MKFVVCTRRTLLGVFFFVIAALIAIILATQGMLVAASSTEKKLPIYSVETPQKKIAITFDAAWSDKDTQTLLGILKKYNAKITVFAVGDWVEQHPESVKAFYDAGHEMGNHSDTHPQMSKLNKSQIIKELQDCNKRIEKVTGKTPAVMRPPSGDYNNTVIETANELGLFPIQWDVDSLDWKKLSVEEMVNRVMDRTRNGSILLFHNGVENTPEALEQILGQLSRQGYQFVPVSDLIYKENYQIDLSGRQVSKGALSE